MVRVACVQGKEDDLKPSKQEKLEESQANEEAFNNLNKSLI